MIAAWDTDGLMHASPRPGLAGTRCRDSARPRTSARLPVPPGVSPPRSSLAVLPGGDFRPLQPKKAKLQ